MPLRHGTRIGGQGPLCTCQQWGCDQALGDKPTRRDKAINVVTAIVVYLAVLSTIVAALATAVWLGYLGAQDSASPTRPVVTPAPYGPPPATTGRR